MDARRILIPGGLAVCEAALLLAAGVPFSRALALSVVLTGLTLLAAWFMLSVRVERERESGRAPEGQAQVDATLQIASETLPIMRQGLNAESAGKTARIIQKISDVAAVAITDRQRVLAFVGAGCENHRPGDNILTEATKLAIATGEMKVVENQRGLSCPRTDCACPLTAAVIVPLKCNGEVVGSLKLYQTHDGALPAYLLRLAQGLAQLLGMQIELAELDHQAQLVTKAELDALRAQINPHFLFNVLNTIIMYSRIDPNKTRRLLIRLADFFRQSLKQPGHFQPLAAELECVRTYLYLEKTRYKEKLKVRFSVEPEAREVQVPVLMIQPLVENAVKHGIAPKLGSGTITISARGLGDQLQILVKDDGVGITQERLGVILRPGVGSGNGVGLFNVFERLRRLYGPDLMFRIESRPGEGTKIIIQFPKAPRLLEEGVGHVAQSSDR